MLQAEGDTMQKFVVLVQYDDLIVTAADQEFVFSCIIKATDSVVSNDDGTGLETDEE